MNTLLDKINVVTDFEVIERVVKGDIPLFEILIRRHNPVLYKIARSYGFHHHDAEDLMQDAHIAAYENLTRFEGKASYKTWLSKIMVNKCLYKLKYGYHKHEKPAEIVGEPLQTIGMKTESEQPEEKTINRELAVVLEQSLQRLPTLYRTVFVLREIEGFSVAETAELLHITGTNVKVRLSRAKALLQQEVEKIYSHPEIYSFNLIYCDAIVQNVLQRIQAVDTQHNSSLP